MVFHISRVSIALLVMVPFAATVPVSGDIIDVIAMGQVGPKDCPLHVWFSAVPDVNYILVVTKQDVVVLTLEELRRWIRIYLPRTREELVTRFDHYIFVDSWLTGWESGPLLTSKQIADIKWSVGEGGMPIFETGIWNSQTTMVEGILASEMEEYYPVDLTKPRQMTSSHLYKVKVSERTDLAPVLRAFLPLGIETFQGQWVGQLYSKQGADVWATLYNTNVPNPPPEGWPWLVSWRVGSKRTLFWVAADDLEVKWWWGFYHPPTQNPYGVDILLNILYHSLGKPLPEDILLLHQLRRRLIEFNEKKAVALAVIEFADRFRANTGPLMNDLQDIEAERGNANRAYLDHDFLLASTILTEAEEALAKVSTKAIKAKDTALLWVYVIEWLVVAATSMITGSVLWALMIKRRLFREVSITRADHR